MSPSRLPRANRSPSSISSHTCSQIQTRSMIQGTLSHSGLTYHTGFLSICSAFSALQSQTPNTQSYLRPFALAVASVSNTGPLKFCMDHSVLSFRPVLTTQYQVAPSAPAQAIDQFVRFSSLHASQIFLIIIDPLVFFTSPN